MLKNINRVVILNNIRSNENVGSIFRTCDAAGVSKIILCGYTPAPLDRFQRENKALSKAALGAEKFVPWEKVEDLKSAINNLKNSPSAQSASQAPHKHEDSEKFKIIAIEQDEKSIDYREIKNKLKNYQNVVLVFGNEVDGLSKEDLELCDLVAEIPMFGQKESLNVAVSVGVVLYSLNS